MKLSDVIVGKHINAQHLDRIIFLTQSQNEKGHALMGNQIGKLISIRNNFEDGRIRLTLERWEKPEDVFDAFIKPGWAVILPLDKSPLLR